MSRYNKILKKIRKATRRNRVESFEYFWEEIERTGFWMRLRVCWTIMWRRRVNADVQMQEVSKTLAAVKPSGGQP